MNSVLLNFLECPEYFPCSKLPEMLNTVFEDSKTIKTNKKVVYINQPNAFDIETSSFISEQSEKTAIMYLWALGINGYCFVGRTWEEFEKTINDISEYLSLTIENRLVIYVHNLAYEFQFIRKRFNWNKVFSLEIRKPVYAVTDSGIEFRCSYLLSGYSLSRLGDFLHTYKIRKLDGALDYGKLRHSKTKLSSTEIIYCVVDVLVVIAYIQERIEIDGDITKIPLTKTGYVRQYCKRKCLGKGKKRNKEYSSMIKTLTIEPDEYIQLKRAFQGGFTHANPFYSGKIIENVASYDFTSSYPAVMVAEKFPMFKSEMIAINSKDELYKNLSIYCCLFDIEFIGLESRLFFESYISISRCWGVKNPTINNGRIVRADRIITTLTEQDFLIIQNFYDWDEIHIANFRRYRKAYLPTEFIESILYLYQQKTQLKGVYGRELEYMQSKEMLNSCYGMAVTDVCRNEIVYSDDWSIEKADIGKSLDKYNHSFGRFLFYPWGVWVTAYARRNLFSGIVSIGNDYIYSDTDSLKITNRENHENYINYYNDNILEKLYAALAWHELDYDLITPKTISGKLKPLGVWDYEGDYKRFKTLGAKRYLTEDNSGLHLTVAGLSKIDGLEYMIQTFDNVFESFNDELYIPPNNTGKNIHTYIDDEREGTIKDYNGIISDYSEKSAVHLSPADYSLSISEEYARYLLSIREDEI